MEHRAAFARSIGGDAAWNFSYRTHFVWEKDKIGLGYWVRNQHGLLLIGVKGDVPAPAQVDRFSSVIKTPLRTHSAKPDIAAEMIVRMPRLEMFARNCRGNEAPPAMEAAQ